MVIDAYVGAFYMKKDVPSSKALESVPKKLELSYFHDIKAEDFSDATIKMIKKNTGAGEYRKIAGKVKRFNALYRNVKKGDRYSITYYPGRGTTLALNKKALGTVKGALFARAIFSVWIGKEPISKKFRSKVLGY